MNVFPKRIVAAAIIFIFTMSISACGISMRYVADPTAAASPSLSDVPSDTPSVSIPPSLSPSESPSYPTPPLVEFTGTVENLFFHPVIAYTKLAFDGDSMQQGLDDYMVTVSEFNKILQSLYDNDYILVSLNDVWTEFTDDAGVARMVRSKLMLPEGKKPIVLTFDDVNYYNYMIKNGFTYKLVVKNGEIWSYCLDPNGTPVYSQDLDAVTILDKFVKLHPDFSFNSAKACLSLTGYEGILGYRTMKDSHGVTPEQEAARLKEVEAVKPVIKLLQETGWYFGCHTWGHIDLSTSSLERVQLDMQRWLDEVGGLVGPTTLFFYPFGARPDGGDVYNTGTIFKYLQSLGFRIFASVGRSSFSRSKPDISAVVCDRMHADGSTLRNSRERYLKFYDAKFVFDPARPDYGVSWA